MLITIFITLKFAGVLASDIGAFIRTLPDKKNHPARSRGINRIFKKSHAMQWAIAGLVVALLSQFAETLKTNRDDRLAQRTNAENQAAQTLILSNLTVQTSRQQQSLSYLERVITPLKPPRVLVRFQLPLDKPAFSSLRNYYERTYGTPQMYRARFDLPGAAKYRGEITEPSPVNTAAPTSIGSQGMVLNAHISSLRFADQFDPGPRFICLPLDTRNTVVSALPVISCLATSLPSLEIQLFSKYANWFPPSSNSWRLPDLLATAQPQPDAIVQYDRLSGTASLLLTLITSTNWYPHLWLDAVPDLVDADCCVCPLGLPPEVSNSLQLQSLTLDFAQASVTLTNFQAYLDHEGRKIFHAKLPSAEGIRLIPNLSQGSFWDSPKQTSP